MILYFDNQRIMRNNANWISFHGHFLNYGSKSRQPHQVAAKRVANRTGHLPPDGRVTSDVEPFDG